MLARILFLIATVLSTETFPSYIIEEVTEIEMLPGSTVQLLSPSRQGSPNSWVIGRFPSLKIIPREGRLGDRFTDRKDEQGRRLQVFTITATRGVPGDEIPMDFWYIKPQYAEQYYNDPSAYEAMHEVVPETKIITFKIKNPDL